VKAEPKLADLSNIKTETSIVDNKKPIVEKNDTVKKSSLKDEKTQNIKRADTSNLTDFAYVIQLGSFSHKANVATLLAKLKKAGFTTFTKPVYTPSGKLTKVFVGPEIKKIALEAKLPKLKALTGLNGKVTIFDVTK
jgi:DedD protein